MRLEQITAKALEKVNYDKYLLAAAVAKRADEISKGEKILLNTNQKGLKSTDIAIMEIAQGLVKIEF